MRKVFIKCPIRLDKNNTHFILCLNKTAAFRCIQRKQIQFKASSFSPLSHTLTHIITPANKDVCVAFDRPSGGKNVCLQLMIHTE